MKSLSLRVVPWGFQVALALAVLCCGGRVEVGAPYEGTGATGAGGSTGGEGGAGAASCDLAIGAACDCSVFPVCPQETVKGIPCCAITKMCSGGESCVVAWTGAVCHDWCDISCELAQDPDQCIAIGCHLTANGCTTP